MKLTELSPQFLALGFEDTTSGPRQVHRYVSSIDEADGILFKCPKCCRLRGEPVGVHSIICWRPRVPDRVTPGPGRWEFSGTGYEDLTLFASSSSILLIGGCGWHGFVAEGRVRDA